MTPASSTPAGESPASALIAVIGLYLAVFTGFTVFVATVFIVVPSVGIPESNPIPLVLVGTIPQLAMLTVGYLYMTRRLYHVPIRIPSARQLGIVVGGTVTVLTIAIGFEIVRSILGIAQAPTVITQAGEQNPQTFLLVAFISLILVGPAEEFLFRGALQGKLRTVFGPVVSIGVPAVLFGVLHVSNYLLAGEPLLSVPLWFAILTIAVNGVAFGAIFEWTGNLVVPILIHGLFNVTLIALSLLLGA